MENSGRIGCCITVDEVKDRLGLSRIRAYELVRSKGFPSFKIGNRFMIPEAAFDQWIHDQIAAKNADENFID